jgi:hypothetical protein
MEPHLMLLFGLAVSVLCFVGFSLARQYRYATLIFDMIQLYPVLIVFSFIVATIASWNTFDLVTALYVQTVFLVLSLVLIYYSVRWISDYSLKSFRELLEKVKSSNVVLISLDDYVDELINKEKVNVFFRHDVDISLLRTLKMARIEKEYGIRSTYFFRLHAERYSFEDAKPIIKILADDGFKIGLHYETLNVTKGNTKKAIELLEYDLHRLREVVPVHAVAAHGQTPHKNRDIWEEVDKATLDISSAYDMKRDMYLSDAGGKSLRDKDGNYLFDRIYEAKPGQIVQVLIHPDWWI